MRNLIVILTVLLSFGQDSLAKPVKDDDGSTYVNPSAFMQKIFDTFTDMMGVSGIEDISDFSEFSEEEQVEISSDNSTTSSEEEFVNGALNVIQQIFGSPFEGSKKVIIFQRVPSTGGEFSIGGDGEASFVNKHDDDSAKKPEDGKGIVVKYSEFHGKAISEESLSSDESVADDSSNETESEEAEPEKTQQVEKKDTKNHSFEFDLTEEENDEVEELNEVESLEEKEEVSKSNDNPRKPIKVVQGDPKDFEWVKNVRMNKDMEKIGELVEKRINESFGADDSEEPDSAEVEDNYKYLADFLRYIGF